VTDADIPSGGVGVVVVAAGSGSRLGAAVPKALVDLAGAPLLDHAVARVLAVTDVEQVVVVAPPGLVPEIAGRYAAEPRVAVVAGGAERSDSVAAGLAVLDERLALVLVHDAARCLTPPEVFDRVIAALRSGDVGVVPGLPVVDTIKRVDEDHLVTATPDRSALWAVQTPQGFTREVLLEAHAPGRRGTDDAVLVEEAGHRVRVVPGDHLAFKITSRADLEQAARLLAGATAP